MNGATAGEEALPAAKWPGKNGGSKRRGEKLLRLQKQPQRHLQPSKLQPLQPLVLQRLACHRQPRTKGRRKEKVKRREKVRRKVKVRRKAKVRRAKVRRVRKAKVRRRARKAKVRRRARKAKVRRRRQTKEKVKELVEGKPLGIQPTFQHCRGWDKQRWRKGSWRRRHGMEGGWPQAIQLLTGWPPEQCLQGEDEDPALWGCSRGVAEQPWPYLYVLSGGWVAMIWSCFGGGWIAMTGSCLWWWLGKSHGLVEFWFVHA